MEFYSGDIIRVKHDVDWHTDFIGRTYILYCVNSLLTPTL